MAGKKSSKRSKTVSRSSYSHQKDEEVEVFNKLQIRKAHCSSEPAGSDDEVYYGDLRERAFLLQDSLIERAGKLKGWLERHGTSRRLILSLNGQEYELLNPWGSWKALLSCEVPAWLDGTYKVVLSLGKETKHCSVSMAVECNVRVLISTMATAGDRIKSGTLQLMKFLLPRGWSSKGEHVGLLMPDAISLDKILDEIAERSNAHAERLLRESVECETPESGGLLRFPREVLETICRNLMGDDIGRMRCCCKRLYHALSVVIPGVKTKSLLLYHQEKALTWMKARESIAASETWYPSLLWKALPLSSTGQSLVINLAEGFALQQEDEMSPFIQAIKGNLATDGYTYEAKKRESAALAPIVRLPPGGILCNDTGYGKTLVCLGLIASCKKQQQIVVTSADPLQRPYIHATLVIVPDNLRYHWVEENRKHFLPGTLRILVIDKLNGSTLCGQTMTNDGSSTRLDVTPDKLVNFDVVLVSHELLARLWSDEGRKSVLGYTTEVSFRVLFGTGERQNAMRARHSGSVVREARKVVQDRALSNALMGVHWARVIVDEGHSMTSVKSNTRDFCTAVIMADRWWLVTATPTPNKGRDESVEYLRILMDFLNVKPYSIDRYFKDAIGAPIKQGSLAAIHSLLDSLSTMIFRNLPREADARLPVVDMKNVNIMFYEHERLAYNIHVTNIQRNLLLCSNDSSDRNRILDSFLHEANARVARLAADNLKKLCSITGYQSFEFEFGDKHRLLQAAYSKCSQTGERVSSIIRAMETMLSDTRQLVCLPDVFQCCRRCRGVLSLPPYFLPCCFRIVCTECIAEMMKWELTDYPVSKHTCTECNGSFSGDDFVRMQPAMPSNDWKEMWLGCASSKVEKVAEIVRSKLEVFRRSIGKKSPKVVVFSQYTETLNRLENEFASMDIGYVLLHRTVGFRAHSSGRQASSASAKDQILKFKSDDSVHVLLMDNAAAHGHDLPFAGTVVLMEPLLDRSLERQVIGRARRLDSQHDTVEVYRIMVEETIEEHIARIRESIEAFKEEGLLLRAFRSAVATHGHSSLERDDMTRLIDVRLMDGKNALSSSSMEEALRNKGVLVQATCIKNSRGAPVTLSINLNEDMTELLAGEGLHLSVEPEGELSEVTQQKRAIDGEESTSSGVPLSKRRRVQFAV